MIYLIDASVYIFRAYFSLPDSFRNRKGDPVNAVYGFTRFLIDLLERERPRYVACAFDKSLTSSFRNRLYPPYKANRESPPPELKNQLRACRLAARTLGIAEFASRRFEADDLIGTLARRHRARNRPVTIVTRDKDLAQLICPGDVFWDFAADERLNREDLCEKHGVLPECVPDLLGLAGDAVDNIPGVRGVGAKTAAALLMEFGSLDALYDNLHRVPETRIRGARSVAAKLAAGRDMAFLSRQLATIYCEAPLNTQLGDLRWQRPEQTSIRRFFHRMNFGAGLRERALRLIGG